MKIEFEITTKENFNEVHRTIFAKMLKEQGKVKGKLEEKANRCEIICIAKHDDTPVGIGAIKKKTKSDFSTTKANLPHLEKEFNWELGYLFTNKAHEGKGIASYIVKLLLQKYGNKNIMASTEISSNPGMVKILERNSSISALSDSEILDCVGFCVLIRSNLFAVVAIS